MTKFPEPPSADELRQRLAPRIHVLPKGFLLWKIYAQDPARQVEWYSFRYYGPVNKSRFDHHLLPPYLQRRGIYYAAQNAITCVAEVFQEGRTIDTTNPNIWLVGFEITRELRLLDLSGTWPTAAQASMAIGTGPRSRARRWSQAIYEAYPDVEGLLYCSSMHANKPAVALYERAENAIPAQPYYHNRLSDPLLRVALENAADDLGYGLL